MNMNEQTSAPQPNDDLPKATGSKMGPEPQALPDDPVSPGNHPIPARAGKVAVGLRPSEVLEQQSPGGEPGSLPGDTQNVGEVGTLIDQVRKAPSPTRTQ
jgi:hypothetical protein